MQTRDEIFDDANGDLAIGELESAVAKYQRCVDLDPNFFDGWHALEMALMKIGRFNEAIEAGKKAVALKPNDQIGWTSLSLFYNRAGNIKEAEAAGAKAKVLSWRKDRQGIRGARLVGRGGSPNRPHRGFIYFIFNPDRSRQ